jgi:hypothetical protein
LDAFAKYNVLAGMLRGQFCDLDLVTTLTLANGTTQEIVHSRRATCRKITRRRNTTVLEFADVDRAALDKLFPFETFTVADFPDLFVDHVGRRVPQGVGTVVKVPLTWVKKSGGVWGFAGPKSTGSNTLLTVYRGSQSGQGSIVSPSEYTTGTMTGVSTGLVVDVVNFTREQNDFQGRPYVLEADYLLSGTRTAPAEISRILGLYGISVDGSFATASTADIAAGFLVDALYLGRTGKAILEDLLRVARGYLVQGAAGAWSIVQDVVKVSAAQFDTAADQIEIGSYGDGEIQKTVSVAYRPRMSGGEDFTGLLQRTTAGPTGELALHFPFVRDHVVADRLASYWWKRLTTLRVSDARIYAGQQANGDRLTITDTVVWSGAKDFILTGITRPGDSNEVKLREYNADIYVYAPGTLPADATNVYAPDYSYTPPAAPTGVQIVSQGTSSDTDGKTTAFALARAVPPAVNWAKLIVQLTDTTTNEIYQAQLTLNGGNYEATISGLRPNRLHSILVWAVNANNLDGATATAANFTTANATTALAAPSVGVGQLQSFEVQIDLGAVADVAGQPKLRRYVLFESVGGGAYAEVKRSEERTFTRPVSHGVVYAYKARSEDVNGNESADSSAASITPQKVVDGSYIVNASINQGRSYTGTGSGSLSITSLSSQTAIMDVYTFFPGFDKGGSGAGPIRLAVPGSKAGQPDAGAIRIDNDDPASNVTVNIDWRKFNA